MPKFNQRVYAYINSLPRGEQKKATNALRNYVYGPGKMRPDDTRCHPRRYLEPYRAAARAVPSASLALSSAVGNVRTDRIKKGRLQIRHALHCLQAVSSSEGTRPDSISSSTQCDTQQGAR